MNEHDRVVPGHADCGETPATKARTESEAELGRRVGDEDRHVAPKRGVE